MNGGDANILRNSDNVDNKLYTWAGNQRKAYKDGFLSDDRATRLRSIGFDWDPRAARNSHDWDEMYAKLCDYQRTIGHTNVPWHYESDKHGKTLGYWVCFQKSAANNERLCDDRKAKLEKLGFDFRLNQQNYDDKWNNKLKELIIYKSAKNGKDPPGGANGIGSWCAVQRSHYRKGTLKQDRMDRLREAGFKFIADQDNISYNAWDNNYQDLIVYKAEHDGDEPYRKVNALGRWCSTQRRNYHKGTLKHDRLDRLRGIGFDFTTSVHRQELYSPKKRDQDTLSESGNRNSNPQHNENARVRIVKAIKEGGLVEKPKAAFELGFDIEDPPESFREPSKLLTLDANVDFHSSDHDVVLPRMGKIDYSLKGNICYKELCHDFQPYYIMAPQNKRRAIAKSLVFVIQKRGGRFFQRDSVGDPFQELRDDKVINKTIRLLGQNQNAKEIQLEVQQLMEERKSLDSTSALEEKQRPSKSDDQTNHEAEVVAQGNNDGNEEHFLSENDDFDNQLHDDEDSSIGKESDLTIMAACLPPPPSYAQAIASGASRQHMALTCNYDNQKPDQSQESTWETQHWALNSYIKKHGHPPRVREDHPSLYDWMQYKKKGKGSLRNCVGQVNE